MAKTILLADDSLTIQKVVELTFMDQDYQVTAVGDGQTALNHWASARFDLVIADVHMPGANGYEVCRQVKTSRPGTPVLLLVGTFETFDDAQAVSCGANGHLKKPFDSQELFRLVDRLILESSSRAQEPVASEIRAPEIRTPESLAPAPPASELFAVPPAPAAPAFSMNPVPSFDPAPAFAAPPVFDPAPAFAAPPAFPAPPVFDPAPAWNPPVAAPPAPEPVDTAPPSPVVYAPAPATVAAAEPGGAEGSLSDADVERIARRVAELIADKAVKEIAWEVVPDLAEVVIKERIRELESQVQ